MLKTGGSETGPLFSLLDPATGKVVGFDAGLSQMLSQYIPGGPRHRSSSPSPPSTPARH